MTDYPEHSKLTKVKDQSQVIGEFLDWLQQNGVHLMEWRTFTEPKSCTCTMNMGHEGTRFNRRTNQWEPCSKCDGTGYSLTETYTVEQWTPKSGTITDWLAEFFEIDLVKIEQEKRAMLDQMRAAN